MMETTTKPMREILFRGKRKDNGEWVEGDFYNVDILYFIIPRSSNGTYSRGKHTIKEVYPCYEVIPETVGQYTGLTDKKDKNIFEGDVCRVTKPCISTRGVITFQKGCFIFKEFNTDSVLELDRLSINQFEIEIIGNIHDNPKFKERGD